LEKLLSQAKNLLIKPPILQQGPATSFEAVIVSAEDVYPAAEFVVMAIEAGREDKLKTLDFKLQLSEPVLWVLP
jgi:hypothetical protein